MHLTCWHCHAQMLELHLAIPAAMCSVRASMVTTRVHQCCNRGVRILDPWRRRWNHGREMLEAATPDGDHADVCCNHGGKMLESWRGNAGTGSNLVLQRGGDFWRNEFFARTGVNGATNGHGFCCDRPRRPQTTFLSELEDQKRDRGGAAS